MSEEKGEKTDKSNNNRMSVKKLVTTNTAPSVEHAILHKPNSLYRDFVSKSADNKKIKCFCCKLIDENEYHNISSRREFQNMTPVERKNAVLRSGLCFNCLGNHKVKNCDKDINCRRCRSPSIPKHFYYCIRHTL